MRRSLLIAALLVLGTAGTAYAATVVTNVYVVSGKITPLKSGTKAHPKPAGIALGYTVGTVYAFRGSEQGFRAGGRSYGKWPPVMSLLR